MRVALIIDSLALGGAQKHVRQVACWLARGGDHVTVWVLNDIVEPLYAEPLRKAGVRIEVVGRTHVLNGTGLIRVAACWHRERVDRVITVLFVSTVFGRVAAQLAGGITVITALQARNLDYKWWQLTLLRLTAGLTDWTISNSRAASAWAQEHEGVRRSRCSFLPNAIDPVEASLPEPRWSEIGLPQLEGRRWVIGSLGRLHQQKGYDLLLEALARLPKPVLTELGVVVWGEGPERPVLEERRRWLGLDAIVHFPGQHGDAVGWLRKLHVYVQPSRFEGMPNAVVEALTVGLPVIAFAVDGIAEICDEDLDLVPGEPDLSVQRFSERLANLLQCTGLRSGSRRAAPPLMGVVPLARLEAFLRSFQLCVV